jgi:hypothetical protein
MWPRLGALARNFDNPRYVDRFDLTDFLHFFNNEDMMGVWSLDYDADVWVSCVVADEQSPDLVAILCKSKA